MNDNLIGLVCNCNIGRMLVVFDKELTDLPESTMVLYINKDLVTMDGVVSLDLVESTLNDTFSTFKVIGVIEDGGVCS